MAFSNIGKFGIATGPVRVGVIYPGGADRGALWIMAHPDGPGEVSVTDFTCRRRVVPGDQARLETSYLVTVTNHGQTTVFSLWGGGNT